MNVVVGYFFSYEINFVGLVFQFFVQFQLN